jgi:PAS domain S-box-containing protein
MNKPTKMLAALIVEDMESDAELIVRLLKNADYMLAYEQVETAEQMRAALEKRTWDIIISDYRMPQFDGHAALQLLKDMELDIPFLVVSGTIGEETAVSMMKAGAHDYLIKGDLGRFIPAVERELEQAEIRRSRKQAEKALAASEVELRALFSSMQDVVLVIDRQGLYRKIAPTNQGLLVKPASELLGMNLRDVFPAEKAEFFIDAIKQVLDTSQTTQIEYELLIGDRTAWFETSISPMDTDSTLWVARDVSGRKQMEEQLLESEARYRRLADHAPDIIFRYDIQPAMKLAYISPSVQLITGYTPQDCYEDPLLMLNMIHPDDKDLMASYMASLNPPEAPLFVRWIGKDGVTRWMESRIVPIQSADGQLIAVEGITRDITERKRAEEALQISEKRYRELFNGMIDGFALHEIICDQNGTPVDYRFLEVNSSFERLTGIQSANLIGKTIYEVMPNTEPYWIEMYGNVASTGRSTFFENYSGELDRYFEVSVYCPRKGQFAVIMVDITDRKRAEDDIHRRVTELEMLYQSGLALSQSLNPKEIGQKILELLEEKLDWHHTGILFYHLKNENDSPELLDVNQLGLKDQKEQPEVVVEHFQSIVSRCMSDWAIQQGKPVRAGDVSIDPHFVEAYSGIRSGLYVPMKLGENMVGVISIEDERPDAFSEADEHLVATLANQAVNAFENARLFEETRQRVLELETLNRILLVLRAATKQDEMLSIVLDEALDILHTSHGSIELFNKTTNSLDQTIVRGWLAQLTVPFDVGEGIAGKVFTSGEIYISREFASDPETRNSVRSQIPPGWGGVCLPIRTTLQTLGVMIVSMPSGHDLNKDEVRLLSILSEMTGSALQRMQLHEQTVHRLEQLNALRAVDQAISSSRDMRLTLNVLLTHTISQLKVDAADVILLNPDSNLLELVGGRGFHTLLPESVRLNDSFAMHAIMEHRLISARDVEIINQYPHFWKLWKEEEFVCYWCIPLIVKGEVKGALEVYCRTMFNPDAEWLEFLEALAGQAAIAIDNTQLFQNLQRANMDLNLAYDATIEGWSRAMDLRDHETEGHTLRVTDLTLRLARAMHISESQLTAIRRGALLHDIGKIGVPDAILLKDGKLTDDEWELMRKHPHLAHDMLAPITYLNDALDIPYCHHEKWDGTGYPQGLRGDHIPLVARIFAIVDVWDALTNDRPYRKKWTKQKVRQYIKDQSGKHFDPQVVDAFLKTIEKK